MAQMGDAAQERSAGEEKAARIRAVLEFCRLTLHQISILSARIYGPDSPSAIPHNLYHAFEQSAAFGPSLAQTCALSNMTGFRVEDWLSVLGIDLGRISGLEAILPPKRTRVLQPLSEDIDLCHGAPAELVRSLPAGSVLPLGQFLRWSRDSRPPTTGHAAVFARIGCEDAFAWPEILPGSIVRVVPELPQTSGSLRHGDPPLRLVEHERGVWCGRFHVSASGAIHAAARELAYAQTPLKAPQEARILGVVDMEIRWLHRFDEPVVPSDLAHYSALGLPDRSPAGPGALVRKGRARSGLTLAEASLLTNEIARSLGNARYAIAQSTLSEYEAQAAPPRQLEKTITLCLIYGIRLDDFISATGTAHNELGQQRMPTYLLPRRSIPDGHQHGQISTPASQNATSWLTAQLGDMPWFLASSLGTVSGIPRLSVRNFYWLSGSHPYLPPHSDGSVLALVDHRKRRPVRLANALSWQQPAWVLILRNGEHRCACCSLEGANLVLYPESDRTRAPEILALGRDVEVVGQVIALARRISRSSEIQSSELSLAQTTEAFKEGWPTGCVV